MKCLGLIFLTALSGADYEYTYRRTYPRYGYTESVTMPDLHYDGVHTKSMASALTSSGGSSTPSKAGVVECDSLSGQCQCQPNVVGARCDSCREGYWNLSSKTGCEPCDCNSVGSKKRSCDVYTGKCDCRVGVQEPKCDRCQASFYGFTSDGCRREYAELTFESEFLSEQIRRLSTLNRA